MICAPMSPPKMWSPTDPGLSLCLVVRAGPASNWAYALELAKVWVKATSMDLGAWQGMETDSSDSCFTFYVSAYTQSEGYL